MLSLMKATPDQLAATRLKATFGEKIKINTKYHYVTCVGSTAKRKVWFNSYDEEWAAFLAASSRRKSRPGFNHADSEPLPRVWNCPTT